MPLKDDDGPVAAPPGVVYTDPTTGTTHVGDDTFSGAVRALTTNYIPYSLFGSVAAATLNVNSTSYIRAETLSFIHDNAEFPFTHYRLASRSQSNAVGETVTIELKNETDATLVGAGNDLTITNTYGTFDSGWLANADLATVAKEYSVYVKGSTATVDWTLANLQVLMKNHPDAVVPPTASGFTLGLDSTTPASSYSYTATGLPAGAKTVVFFVWGVSSTPVVSITGLNYDTTIPAISVAPLPNSTAFPMAVFFTDQITGTSSAINVAFSATMTGCVMGHVVITGAAVVPYARNDRKASAAGVMVSNAAACPSANAISLCAYTNDKNTSPFTPTFSADAGTPSTLVSASASAANLYYGVLVNTDTTATTFTSTGPSSGVNQAMINFTWDAVATVPIIDGAATSIFSLASSGSVTLSNSRPGNVACVLVGYEGGTGGTLPRTVTSVTAAGLTFTRRGGGVAQKSGRPNDVVDLWWAPASAILTAKSITVTLSGGIDDASVIAFSVAGVDDINAPFDANVSLPAVATTNAAGVPTPPVISTTSANDLLFGGSLVVNGFNDTTSSWINFANADNSGGSLFWSWVSAFSRNVTATQSSVSTPFNGTDTWTAIRYADAFRGSPP